MRKVIIIFFIFPVLLFCRTTLHEKEIEIPNLNENLYSYIKSKKCFEKPTKLVVVSVVLKNDTTIVEFVDTYPNIYKEKFRLDTLLYDSRVIFTGEKVKSFSKNESDFFFPQDIVNEVQLNQDYMFNEYTGWVYFYKNGKLIYQERPCDERK